MGILYRQNVCKARNENLVIPFLNYCPLSYQSIIITHIYYTFIISYTCLLKENPDLSSLDSQKNLTSNQYNDAKKSSKYGDPFPYLL